MGDIRVKRNLQAAIPFLPCAVLCYPRAFSLLLLLNGFLRYLGQRNIRNDYIIAHLALD